MSESANTETRPPADTMKAPDVTLDQLNELADFADKEFVGEGPDGSVAVMNGGMELVRVETVPGMDAREMEQSLMRVINSALIQMQDDLDAQLERHAEAVPELRQLIEDEGADEPGDVEVPEVFSGSSDDGAVRVDVSREKSAVVALQLRDTTDQTIAQIPTAVNRAIAGAMQLDEEAIPLGESVADIFTELQETLGKLDAQLDEVESRITGWERDAR